ncbi:1253_t:CDS:1, partial [Funneliformis caledonium]
AHDESLDIKICQGLRPSSDYKVPFPILDNIRQCLDAVPLKRPTAENLYNAKLLIADRSFIIKLMTLKTLYERDRRK